MSLGPVIIGALVLAALTYLLYRSVRRRRESHNAGQLSPRTFPILVGGYVVAWIGYGFVIAGAMAGVI